MGVMSPQAISMQCLIGGVFYFSPGSRGVEGGGEAAPAASVLHFPAAERPQQKEVETAAAPSDHEDAASS